MNFVHNTSLLVTFLARCVGWAEHYSWYIIHNTWPFVIVVTVMGFLALNVKRYYPQDDEPREIHTRWDQVLERLRKIPFRPTWRLTRSIAGALAGLSFSSGLVMGSILLHLADPYWLPAGTEKASHIPPPHIGTPAIHVPGGGLPGIGGPFKALAGAITEALQHTVAGTNSALGGVTNAGNAMIDTGLRIRAATIAGQVAYQFGVIWLVSSFLLAIFITVGLVLFIARTAHKLGEIWDWLKDAWERLQELGQDIFSLKRQVREQRELIAYMAELLRHGGIWPADQPTPTRFYADDTAQQTEPQDHGPRGRRRPGPPGMQNFDWQ